MPGKQWAVIIDHVGNVKRHGLPDARRAWSLERRERRGGPADDVIPVRTCGECGASYEAVRAACPYCRKKPEPAGRSSPDLVEGDLYEMDPAVLARMRGEMEEVFHAPRIPEGMPSIGVRQFIAAHGARQDAVLSLRNAIMQYGGMRHAQGDSDSEMQRRFWFTFGIDVWSALTLKRAEAADLEARVRARLQ
jgi:glutaredoxin